MSAEVNSDYLRVGDTLSLTTFRLFFQLSELSCCASLSTFSLFPQDIKAVFLSKQFACRSGCNQIWGKEKPMCIGGDKKKC